MCKIIEYKIDNIYRHKIIKHYKDKEYESILLFGIKKNNSNINIIKNFELEKTDGRKEFVTIKKSQILFCLQECENENFDFMMVHNHFVGHKPSKDDLITNRKICNLAYEIYSIEFYFSIFDMKEKEIYVWNGKELCLNYDRK